MKKKTSNKTVTKKKTASSGSKIVKLTEGKESNKVTKGKGGGGA